MCRYQITQSLVKNLISIESFSFFLSFSLSFFPSFNKLNKGHICDREAQKISTKSHIHTKEEKASRIFLALKTPSRGKRSSLLCFRANTQRQSKIQKMFQIITHTTEKYQKCNLMANFPREKSYFQACSICAY